MFLPTLVWLLIALYASLTSAAKSVSSTILVIARDAVSATSATSGLQGYGIPYQVVTVPQGGITLPALTSSETSGNYGGVIVLSEVAYEYPTGWASAITPDQWQTIYNYQDAFGIRLVRLDSFPSTDLGVTSAIVGAGCCNTGVEQLVSISDGSAFPTANIKTGATVSTQGLWHFPAVLTNATIAQPIAVFAADAGGTFTTETIAAIINNFGERQQMVWFVGFATDWSQTSNYLQHAYIHWMTRGLFVGNRKIYFGTQVDDMHLDTELYLPANTTFRIRTSDLEAHKEWQAEINTRLPPGSDYFLDIGHNGNGDMIAATAEPTSEDICAPDYPIFVDAPSPPPVEFQKPLGTGTDLWPPEFEQYTWTLGCAALDDIATWFMNNRDVFASVSHTFTHQVLTNATYHDASREVYFNIAWLKQIGLYDSPRFSPLGLIPPGITGLRNGDVIRAWLDNGMGYVVGDNTRPVLRNPTNSFWPAISNTELNGYTGLTIVPRWATTMYYNCWSQQCTLQEWIATSGGSGDFANLVDDARRVNTRYLLGLHHDPFMFHQANMRTGDVDNITIGPKSGPLSLLQIWVETVLQEMTRLTNWPILTLKHDDIAKSFLDRMALDDCNPNMVYNYSEDGRSIVSVTLLASGNACDVPVPVTVPGRAMSDGLSNLDQVGTEPAIYWTDISGSPVTLTLSSPLGL
ncbi:non-anchored cell wall protein-1 [Naviculisporaceae sp. PSN 640]